MSVIKICLLILIKTKELILQLLWLWHKPFFFFFFSICDFSRSHFLCGKIIGEKASFPVKCVLIKERPRTLGLYLQNCTPLKNWDLSRTKVIEQINNHHVFFKKCSQLCLSILFSRQESQSFVYWWAHDEQEQNKSYCTNRSQRGSWLAWAAQTMKQLGGCVWQVGIDDRRSQTLPSQHSAVLSWIPSCSENPFVNPKRETLIFFPS